MCVKIYQPSLAEKTCVQLSSAFLWWAWAWMHQRAGEEKKKMGMINNSAARHPSIDSLTPINEGQRCLGFIKVATYEILKWARQQHNVELHMTSHQKQKMKEGKKERRETSAAEKKIALTRGEVREILTSASQKLRQHNSAMSIFCSPKNCALQANISRAWPIYWWTDIGLSHIGIDVYIVAILKLLLFWT